jgi:ATP-dependent helicase/DNAse subunit B
MFYHLQVEGPDVLLVFDDTDEYVDTLKSVLTKYDIPFRVRGEDGLTTVVFDKQFRRRLEDIYARQYDYTRSLYQNL